MRFFCGVVNALHFVNPRYTRPFCIYPLPSLGHQVDKSLDEWPPDDWRLFVGDLGNEVTEDLLARAFSKVLAARVWRRVYLKQKKGEGKCLSRALRKPSVSYLLTF